MENLGSILISTILSGIFATIVTLWWQGRSQVKQEKIKIFTILMSKRYEISAEESVDALNMIDVIFHSSPKVRGAWKSFQDATRLPESSTKTQSINDKQLKLLEMIAEDIGYKDIHWDDIKEYYYPVGLSERKRDEAVLRKVQIDASLAQINKHEQGDGNARVDSKTEMENQMVMKALENPESFIKLIEAAEKAQNLTKGQRKK
jgi:hypothetical protein